MTASTLALLALGLALLAAATRARSHGVLGTWGLAAVAAGIATAILGNCDRHGDRHRARDPDARACPSAQPCHRAEGARRKWRERPLRSRGARLACRRGPGARSIPSAKSPSTASSGGGARAVTELFILIVVLIGALALAAGSAIRVVREYERAVVFRLGRLIGQKGPVSSC